MSDNKLWLSHLRLRLKAGFRPTLACRLTSADAAAGWKNSECPSAFRPETCKMGVISAVQPDVMDPYVRTGPHHTLL